MKHLFFTKQQHYYFFFFFNSIQGQDIKISKHFFFSFHQTLSKTKINLFNNLKKNCPVMSDSYLLTGQTHPKID